MEQEDDEPITAIFGFSFYSRLSMSLRVKVDTPMMMQKEYNSLDVCVGQPMQGSGGCGGKRI